MPRLLRTAAALTVLLTTVLAARAWAAAGDLDLTFSGNGKLTFGFPHDGHESDGYSVAIQRDQRIVVAGLSPAKGSGEDFTVARLRRSGRLDRSFSSDGRRRAGPANCLLSNGGFDAVAIEPDQKVVVAGYSCPAPKLDKAEFTLTRLNPNGSLDRGFGRRGRLHIPFRHPSGNLVSAIDVATQRDGKIVVVGSVDDKLDVARVTRGGKPDPRFSGNGRMSISIGRHDVDGEGVALQRDGKIVIVGTATTGSPGGYRMAVARLRPNGELDQGFSHNGRTTIGFGTPDSEATSVAVKDGRIVVVGTSRQADSDRASFALARLTADGTLDPTFSGDGRQSAAFTGTGTAIAFGVAIAGDGKIVAAGDSARDPHGRFKFAVARFTPGGDLDPSFAGDGRQTTQFGTGGTEGAAAFGVALQRDGKILAAGDAEPRGSRSAFAVARYKAG